MIFEEITGISKKINILDLGAKLYSSNDQKYNNLSISNICGIDYFPDERSISKNKKYYNHIINAVIGDGSSRKLYITEMESCSSLFIPNQRLLENFQTLSEWMKIKNEILVNTIKLNDLELPFFPDFIKSDIQGSDLYAIQYGSKYFDNALVLEIEVEFLQQYEDQPLFSEIELILRSKGFVFHSFTGYGSRFLKPAENPIDPYDTLNQWMWSHAVFVKDYLTLPLSSEEYIKIALIAHNVYGSYDLALHCLKKSDVDETNYKKFFFGLFQNETN